MNESSTNDGRGPLAGVRVLDISRFIAGPYGGQLLAFLGAEVIKVEAPDGDPMRELSKYQQDGFAAHYLSGNASKKSVTLNLKHAEGRRVFLELVAHADVVLENFRPGTMERLNLDYEQLKRVNPKIILGSVTGFGQSGPWKDLPAYDLIAQAAGGGMSLTGRPGEAPVKMGVPIGDLGAGVFIALGIAAALYRRKCSGEGEAIDVSMMDVQLSLLNYHAHYYWMSGESPEPEGDGHPNVVPYQSFRTSTGPMVVAVYGDPFWPGFCDALERPDLLKNVRYATNDLRCKNRSSLIQLLQSHLLGAPRELWLQRLIEHGIPAAPLHTVGEALESPQAIARNMALSVRGHNDKEVTLLGNPIKLRSGTPVPAAPPGLGQHTDDVLCGLLGYTMTDVAKLRQAGVL